MANARAFYELLLEGAGKMAAQIEVIEEQNEQLMTVATGIISEAAWDGNSQQKFENTFLDFTSKVRTALQEGAKEYAKELEKYAQAQIENDDAYSQI